MRVKTIFTRTVALLLFFSVCLISCEDEDSGSTTPDCNYTTFNPNNAGYDCADSGFIQVGEMKCCPSNAPYYCSGTNSCYTTCTAASNAGCGNIIFATTGGGGGGPCDEPYNGPTGDIQSDAFCQAAWNYRCYGQDAQADQQCAVYRQMQQDNPGMPDCPYCD